MNDFSCLEFRVISCFTLKVPSCCILRDASCICSFPALISFTCDCFLLLHSSQCFQSSQWRFGSFLLDPVLWMYFCLLELFAILDSYVCSFFLYETSYLKFYAGIFLKVSKKNQFVVKVLPQLTFPLRQPHIVFKWCKLYNSVLNVVYTWTKTQKSTALHRSSVLSHTNSLSSTVGSADEELMDFKAGRVCLNRLLIRVCSVLLLQLLSRRLCGVVLLRPSGK